MGTSALKTNSSSSKRTGMPSINGACVLIEYLPRGTLKSYLIKNRGRKLPFKIVIRLALDLARGSDSFPKSVFALINLIYIEAVAVANSS
jgi:hypothetical protein